MIDGEVVIHGQFVNSDLARVARSYLNQAHAIQDDEPNASERRQRLLRAAAHLHLAEAELDGIPVRPVGAPVHFATPSPPTHVLVSIGDQRCRWCEAPRDSVAWVQPCQASKPLDRVFDLSLRARSCLERNGIVTLGQLLLRTEDDLLSLKNFGQTTVNELKGRLVEAGLHLARSSRS